MDLDKGNSIRSDNFGAEFYGFDTTEINDSESIMEEFDQHMQELFKISTSSDDDTDEKHTDMKEDSEVYYGDEMELSYIEKVRLECIRERNELLRSLGLLNEIPATSDPYKPKKKAPRVSKPRQSTPIAPTRKSLRLEQRKEGYTEVKAEIKTEISDESEEENFSDNRTLGSINVKEEDCFQDQQFIEKLRGLSNSIYSKGLKVDLASLSIKELQAVLFSLELNHYPRILQKRIQSLAIHPSPHLLVFAGAVDGSIALWDSDGGEEARKVHYHRSPVNCLSVCRSNVNKLFSTSHDGTFGMLDVTSFDYCNLYATDISDRTRHMTWHEQVDAHNFLLCHGNGSVGLTDIRTDKDDITWIKCFDRSARTAQLHPKKENYFLVSSGTGHCSIYDLRKKSSVVSLKEPSGLTSSFFSPDGTKILSTCNDNTLKIYSLNHSEWTVGGKKSITHNNHTGRWLSVFKANWIPGRSDAFHVGSLLDPRRIQFFTTDGEIIAELKSEDMTTIQPVITVHNSEPLIVGGNSSGRIHCYGSPL